MIPHPDLKGTPYSKLKRLNIPKTVQDRHTNNKILILTELTYNLITLPKLMSLTIANFFKILVG